MILSPKVLSYLPRIIPNKFTGNTDWNMTSTLPRPRLQTAALEQRQPIVNQIRMRALERLYARRDAVEALIQSLEDYEETRQANRAKCLPFIVSRKLS